MKFEVDGELKLKTRSSEGVFGTQDTLLGKTNFFVLMNECCTLSALITACGDSLLFSFQK